MLSFSVIFGHILAMGIGLSLGLIGGGGSVLAVPILVYVMGVSPKQAIAMSLAIVGTVSLIGVLPHWQQGNVRFKVAALFTPLAMLGAYLGARLASLVNETLQLVCFGVVMVLASVLMIRKSRPRRSASITPDLPAPDSPAPDRSTSEPIATQPPTQQRLLKQILIPIEGFGVGLLSGFVGVGGGFAIIPALVLLAGIPMKQAVGTSLVIIALNSVTGFLGYIDQVTLNLPLMLSFTGAASLGMLAGARLQRSIDGSKLQQGFGYFLLAIAVFILIKH